jgi:hypothetical protein
MGSPAVTTGSKPQTAVIDIGVLRTIARKTVVMTASFFLYEGVFQERMSADQETGIGSENI